MPNIQEIRSKYPQYSDMSDEQLTSALHQKYYSDMPETEFRARIMPQTKAPGFTDRVGERLLNRANEGADALVAYKAGDQGVAQTALQMAGKMGAGAAADIIGEGINSVLPESVKQGAKNAASSAATAIDNTGIGRKVGDVLMNARNSYQGFTKENPNAARSIESAANIASVLPAGRVAGEVTKPVTEAAKGLEGLSNAYATKYPGATPFDKITPQVTQSMNADMVRGAAKNAYKFVEESGTTLTPRFTNEALSVLENAKQKPIANKVLTSEDAEINKALGEYADLKDSPLTMSDLQKFDSTLGDKAAQAYVSGNFNKGRIVSQAQDKIRGMLHPDNLSPTYMAGGREGVDALMQHAIPLWSTQAKMADIEKIIDRANMMDNPSTGIKTGFRNLALNKNRMASYPPKIQSMIKKAAKTGIADDILGIFGSRLNPMIWGTLGGIPGAIAATAVSGAIRGVRSGLKEGQAQKVADTLASGVRSSVEKYNTPQNIKLPQKPQGKIK